MGRKAALSYEQVKAVINALRAEGAKPSIDKVWEALDRAGSKGTVHKLVKQYMAELDGAQQAPESLRLLPHDVQQIILAFADQTASMARERIADELIECRQAADSLAADNERLTAELDALQAQLALAGSDKSVAEGRAAQLENELAAARLRIDDERAATEQARVALARAELRLESMGRLEEELRSTRAEAEGQRETRIEAQRAVAVLGSQRKDQEERISDLKSELAGARDACARSDTRNADLSQALERERLARAAVERDLAVLAAVQAGTVNAEPKKGKDSRQRTSGRRTVILQAQLRAPAEHCASASRRHRTDLGSACIGGRQARRGHATAELGHSRPGPPVTSEVRAQPLRKRSQFFRCCPTRYCGLPSPHAQ